MPKGEVKDRRKRDLGSYQKAALSAVSNVMVKFVSQKAPAGVKPCHSVVFSHTLATESLPFGGQTPGWQKSRDERGGREMM